MKNKIFWLVFSAFSIFLFTVFNQSCGSDEGAKVDCEKICNKEKECNTDMTASDVTQCKSTCEKISKNGYYQDSFINEVNKCYDKACSDINSCIENSSGLCKAPDYMPYVNAVCDKMIECDPSAGTKEACVSGGKSAMEQEISKGGSIKCLTDRAFTDMGSCIKNASCSNFDNDAEKCVNEIIGM